MFKKLEALIKKYPYRTIITVFFILIIIPPLVINWIYKTPAFWEIMLYDTNSTIPPGTLLSYWGTVLTFCATFSLSMIVYIQNKNNNISKQLVTNEASITIIEGSSAELTIFDILEFRTDLNFEFEIKVFSSAKIHLICLKSIIFSYKSFDDKKFDVNIETNNENFELKKTTDTDMVISTGCIEINNELKTFLMEKNMLTVKMKIEIICNDVITPVNIILGLKKQKLVKYNNFKYSVESPDIFTSKPRIKEND